jgi:hypothetical protein
VSLVGDDERLFAPDHLEERERNPSSFLLVREVRLEVAVVLVGFQASLSSRFIACIVETTTVTPSRT